MQKSLSRLCRWVTIIGLLTVVLAGCSAVRLGYNQAPQLAHWWLDGYFDFRSDQSPRVKAALEQWFAWHRSTQLGDYAALLASAQMQVTAPVNAAQVCRWADDLHARLDPAVERALPLIADLVPALTPEQLKHLEARYTKSNNEFRKSYLQPGAGARLEASIERAVDRLESLYGDLDAAQQRLVAAGVTVSPFDAETWFAERQARQREVLRILGQLVTDRPDRDATLAALRQLARRMDGASSASAHAYQDRLKTYNCDFGARMHNAMTRLQREHARGKLREWEEDLRSLAGTAHAALSTR